MLIIEKSGIMQETSWREMNDTVMNYPFYLNMIDLLADEYLRQSVCTESIFEGRLNKNVIPYVESDY